MRLLIHLASHHSDFSSSYHAYPPVQSVQNMTARNISHTHTLHLQTLLRSQSFLPSGSKPLNLLAIRKSQLCTLQERGGVVPRSWTQCMFVMRNIPTMVCVHSQRMCVSVYHSDPKLAQDHWRAGSYQANELDLRLSWTFGNSPPWQESALILSVALILWSACLEKAEFLCIICPVVWSTVFVPHTDVCDSRDQLGWVSEL